VIHTKQIGEISEASSGKAKEELDQLPGLANDIDKAKSPHKAIVSFLMLKEGWDVRNVTTIVGLRSYSSKSKPSLSKPLAVAFLRCISAGRSGGTNGWGHQNDKVTPRSTPPTPSSHPAGASRLPPPTPHPPLRSPPDQDRRG
jgi:hypothetical protein